jgi:cytochrome c oxidase assembly factor CtaG
VSGPPVARPDRAAGARRWLAALGAVLALAVVVAPLRSLARTSEVANALQFAVLALAVPALVVVGAPWRALGGLGRLAERRAWRRARSSGTVALAGEVLVVVVWRTPGVVSAIGHHPWLLAVEAVTLVVAGVALWLELAASPPMTPRTTVSRRIVLATVAMWTVWIVAYVAGMAHGQGYPGFHHHPGAGLSGVADKQLATALLFAAAAAAYLPVVFASLFSWLGAEERAGTDAAPWVLRPERGPRTDEVRAAG